MNKKSFISFKCTLALLVLFSATSGSSQSVNDTSTSEPLLFLKGSMSYHYTNHKKIEYYSGTNKKETIIEALPQFGFHILSSLIIGVECGFRHYHDASLPNYDYPLYGGTVIYGPFIRYENKIPGAKNLGFFISGTFETEQTVSLITRISDWGQGSDYSESINLHKHSFYTTVGLSYKISKAIDAEINLLSLNYSWYKLNSDEFDASRLQFLYNIIQPNIGLSFRF